MKITASRVREHLLTLTVIDTKVRPSPLLNVTLETECLEFTSTLKASSASNIIVVFLAEVTISDFKTIVGYLNKIDNVMG